ncbi:MAG: hypothetical protein R3E02_06380 [Blastomonas sp.]
MSRPAIDGLSGFGAALQRRGEELGERAAESARERLATARRDALGDSDRFDAGSAFSKRIVR